MEVHLARFFARFPELERAIAETVVVRPSRIARAILAFGAIGSGDWPAPAAEVLDALSHGHAVDGVVVRALRATARQMDDAYLDLLEASTMADEQVARAFRLARGLAGLVGLLEGEALERWAYELMFHVDKAGASDFAALLARALSG